MQFFLTSHRAVYNCVASRILQFLRDSCLPTAVSAVVTYLVTNTILTIPQQQLSVINRGQGVRIFNISNVNLLIHVLQ